MLSMFVVCYGYLFLNCSDKLKIRLDASKICFKLESLII